MAAIRSGIVVLLICALPTAADAGCGLFHPCGSPSWIGFSLALPVPRLPHLRPFAVHSCQSPLCGCGHLGHPGGCGYGGCGLFGHRCRRPFGFGRGNPCCAPASPCAPPVLSAPPVTPPMLVPPQTTCNPCETALTQTQFIPQQTITYRDVPQVQYREEAYTATVPVTSYQQVTRTRTVPYQTVARIPQVSTQYVPQMTAAGPCPCTAGLAAPILPGTTAALPYSPVPAQAAGIPEYPYPVTQPQADASAAWQPIPQKRAEAGTEIQKMGYGYAPSLPVQPVTSSARPSMFRPAPTAARAWQSRFLR